MLTKEGEEKFAEVLDYEIALDFSGDFKTAAVKIDGDDGNGWKRRLRKSKEFFYALAGYCADEDYQKWFEEPTFGQYALDPDANMIVSVYCDTTPWFTEEEMNYDNICEMWFPRKMVQDYYINCGGDIINFVTWITEEYTCDEVDGLFEWCKNHGFIAVRED